MNKLKLIISMNVGKKPELKDIINLFEMKSINNYRVFLCLCKILHSMNPDNLNSKKNIQWKLLSLHKKYKKIFAGDNDKLATAKQRYISLQKFINTKINLPTKHIVSEILYAYKVEIENIAYNPYVDIVRLYCKLKIIKNHRCKYQPFPSFTPFTKEEKTFRLNLIEKEIHNYGDEFMAEILTILYKMVECLSQ